jgi:hypothetical protein
VTQRCRVTARPDSQLSTPPDALPADLPRPARLRSTHVRERWLPCLRRFMRAPS